MNLFILYGKTFNIKTLLCSVHKANQSRPAIGQSEFVKWKKAFWLGVCVCVSTGPGDFCSSSLHFLYNCSTSCGKHMVDISWNLHKCVQYSALRMHIHLSGLKYTCGTCHGCQKFIETISQVDIEYFMAFILLRLKHTVYWRHLSRLDWFDIFPLDKEESKWSQ